jgi:hypothetical protein
LPQWNDKKRKNIPSRRFLRKGPARVIGGTDDAPIIVTENRTRRKNGDVRKGPARCQFDNVRIKGLKWRSIAPITHRPCGLPVYILGAREPSQNLLRICLAERFTDANVGEAQAWPATTNSIVFL